MRQLPHLPHCGYGPEHPLFTETLKNCVGSFYTNIDDNIDKAWEKGWYGIFFKF